MALPKRDDINLIELICSKDALTWTDEEGHCNVILVLNSKNSLSCINKNRVISWKYLRIILEIQVAAARIPSLKILRMWRETNGCTDFLAKQGLNASNIAHVSLDNIHRALIDVTANDFYFWRVGLLGYLHTIYHKKNSIELIIYLILIYMH